MWTTSHRDSKKHQRSQVLHVPLRVWSITTEGCDDSYHCKPKVASFLTTFCHWWIFHTLLRHSWHLLSVLLLWPHWPHHLVERKIGLRHRMAVYKGVNMYVPSLIPRSCRPQFCLLAVWGGEGLGKRLVRTTQEPLFQHTKNWRWGKFGNKASYKSKFSYLCNEATLPTMPTCLTRHILIIKVNSRDMW